MISVLKLDGHAMCERVAVLADLPKVGWQVLELEEPQNRFGCWVHQILTFDSSVTRAALGAVVSFRLRWSDTNPRSTSEIALTPRPTELPLALIAQIAQVLSEKGHIPNRARL
jgi:hypothetical protein